eukprot:TRINITY_DN18379_c0_g1_i1.p1 TRINITY_DN18379_c0_g1~~TRINITY_DN18379_c0_g1_i1.p1  ORF type:complete len:211 (-),score=36.55 TRINITY_DN18379_c0_g1_i1:184-816(-)
MKVVLIGDSSVGKSALVHRFMENQSLAQSKATVGVAFFRRGVLDPETHEEHALQIWDTAGQEKFQSVTTHHYRNADAGLVVFDITNEMSFLSVDRWLNELRENTDPSVQLMLVGNKADLTQKRVVSEQRAMTYARNNALLYVETSSLWDRGTSARGYLMGIEPALVMLVKAVVEHHRAKGHNSFRLDMSGFYGSNKNFQLGSDEKAGCEC